MSKKADLTQATLQAMFADSILIRVSPAEDGFVCSIVENNRKNIFYDKIYSDRAQNSLTLFFPLLLLVCVLTIE